MRTLLLAAVLMTAPTLALGQDFQGNWACKAQDGSTAGLLTIYSPSYGYASPVTGDPASGTGSITGYSDGVAFNDGNLKSKLGIEAGRVVTTDAGIAMQLETSSAVMLLCKPR